MGNFKVVADSLNLAAEQMSEPRYDGPDKQHPDDPYGLDVPDAALPETKEAVNQLKNSTGVLMTALKAGDAETKRLIRSLRSAAAAYTEMDERSAKVLGTQGTDSSKAPPIEPVTPKPIDDSDLPKIDIEYGGYPSSPDDQWAKWTTAARAINEHGDPEAMQRVETFQRSWAQYQSSLTDWVDANIRLDLVANWEGDAAVACKNALIRLRSWWNDMGNECHNLSVEAGKLLSAHKQLASVHPNMHDVEVDGNGWLNPIDWSNFQYQSEYDRNNYENNIDLTQIRPGGPPQIGGLPNIKSNDVGTRPGTQVPQFPGTGPGDVSGPSGPANTGETPAKPEIPSVSPAGLDPSAGEKPSSGSPSGGSPSGGQGSGSPSGGGAPSGGMPSGLPKGPEGMPEMPGLGEPSLKPASAGGGGGMGGGGMPSMPLGPAVGADSVAASPAGARSVGGGVPGAPGGAGMGGMGGGMGGMGGGHGQGQGKEKRRNPNLSEDEDLYKEDRAYTEAVIGRRARPDAKDTKK